MNAHEVTRIRLKTDFIKNYFGNSEFKIQPLPADASFRTYDRVTFQDKSFILMDCPPIYYSLIPFIKIAKTLQTNKFSAPEIYKEDHENGFLLLEDFGQLSIGAYLLETQNADTTVRTYKIIIDLLVQLQNIKPPIDLELYNEKILLKELELYLDWYIPHKYDKQIDIRQREEFLNIWTGVFQKLPNMKPCLVLRDYHVENMMLLDRAGINSIGLLDFQDAVIGHPFYDVISVLEDARSDLSRELGAILLDYYLSKRDDISKMEGLASYHILAAQRNLRILGVFARKAVRDKQENYLKYIPRLLNYLEFDLSHETLLPVKKWIKNNI